MLRFTQPLLSPAKVVVKLEMCKFTRKRDHHLNRIHFALMLKGSEHGEYEYEACTNVLFEMK